MTNALRPIALTWTPRPTTLAAILILGMATPARPQAPLPVAARVESGESFLAGQGVNLTIVVAAGDQRPSLELPALKGARLWKTSSSFQPISAGGIGGFQAGENAFVTRLRLVAESPGVVDVPSIIARLDDREGRSRPLRLTFENPPIAGRPPGFLGGVGDFQLQAELEQSRVRVGREVEYRIRVSGPAAWGMTTRPDLARLQVLAIAPRVEALAVQAVDEPPSRTFIYRIKPTKPGEVVLPPVSIASFDPRTKRYMTRATRGVALQVVAAPVFDAGELDYQLPGPSRLRAGLMAMGALILGAAVVFGAAVAGRRLRRRWSQSNQAERGRARKFAREVADRLGAKAPSAPGSPRTRETRAEANPPGFGTNPGHPAGAAQGESLDPDRGVRLAREIMDALIAYARLGAGRPPGALTPDEARGAVARASGSESLGERAARLTARCDRILFAEAGEANGEEEEEGGCPRRDAQALFAALGRSNGWLRPGLGWGRKESVAPEPQRAAR